MTTSTLFRETPKGLVARHAPVLEAPQRLGLLFGVGQPVGGSGKGQQRLVLLLRAAPTLREGRRFQPYQGPELVAGYVQ